MAVSGRKIADFKDSVSVGSAEDFDHRCDPCLTENQVVEAQGFCVDCQEYLCNSCYKFHQKTKALRGHQLLDKDNLGEAGASTVLDVCTEKCSVHKNEVIKFFCPEHEDVGCTDCMTMHHRTCDLDYIPDNCTGIGDSDEYKDVTGKIDQKLKEIDEVMKSANETDTELEKCYDKIMEEISIFRQEINTRLDKLQADLQNNALKIKTTGKETTKHVIDLCTRVSSEIKSLQTSLQNDKTDKQYGRLYVSVKRAKSILKTKELREAEESLNRMNVNYKFERNKGLETCIISKEYTFGKLTFTPRETDGNVKLILKEDMSIKTKTDVSFFKCCISGCAVLPSGKIVIVDNSKNKKVKVIDRQTRAVIGEKMLESQPFDVAAVSTDRIAVTLPDQKEILLISFTDNISVIHRVSINGVCKGITYQKGQIYTVCKDPACVFILDQLGNVKRTISLDENMFQHPCYIEVSEDCKSIYICDNGTQSVKCITLQGQVIGTYQFEQYCNPKGVTILDNGSLLLCCTVKETIFLLSGDLKKCRELAQNIYGVQSICYDRNTKEICVGGISCNILKVFYLK